jgi:hypothetical protein
MNVENILPFAFPFGIGGPNMKQKVKVSFELCIQLCIILSLQEFMEGPTILVMNHTYNWQMSYKSGVIMGPRGAPTTCHNQHDTSRSYSFGQI